MLKKLFILYLLLFSYTIVVGHNIIPHDHFEDLLNIPHDHLTQGGNHHEHHFPFSHSITLHITDEKQSIVTIHCFNSGLKTYYSDDFVAILFKYRPPLIFSSSSGLFHYLSEASIQISSPLLSDRAPPSLLA